MGFKPKPQTSQGSNVTDSSSVRGGGAYVANTQELYIEGSALRRNKANGAGALGGGLCVTVFSDASHAAVGRWAEAWALGMGCACRSFPTRPAPPLGGGWNLGSEKGQLQQQAGPSRLGQEPLGGGLCASVYPERHAPRRWKVGGRWRQKRGRGWPVSFVFAMCLAFCQSPQPAPAAIAFSRPLQPWSTLQVLDARQERKRERTEHSRHSRHSDGTGGAPTKHTCLVCAHHTCHASRFPCSKTSSLADGVNTTIDLNTAWLGGQPSLQSTQPCVCLPHQSRTRAQKCRPHTSPAATLPLSTS